MDIVEKRDYIHRHLHIANESTLNEFYETLRKEELKTKLESRAHKSEADIQSGKVFSRDEVKKRTSNPGQ
ncbi:hypothetical protein [Abyssalbus ytuae]|uniref:Uncharacterized protein n=1 Tax=Abyssalbus ytuae TaxID=2926907 RepID=A0A9E6ZXN3_9FLAO|nr:hypothetical protein [Abyssalbus ytuae]UOB17062.1 hypothetical protein MQE35_15140 [Abyssalbus ytuae]